MRRRCLAIGEPKAKAELSTAATAHQSESVSLSFCPDLSRRKHGCKADRRTAGKLTGVQHEMVK